VSLLAIGCEAVVKKAAFTAAEKPFRLYREQAHSYRKTVLIQMSFFNESGFSREL